MQLTATFPTERGPALMGTMAKHFGHKIQVEASDTRARLHFAAGTATIALTPTGLHLTVEAPEAEPLDMLRGVVESHLLRFAHREAPHPLDWQAA
ncbi:DUF2218 domain-containing protein [Paracoccus bogoriensis]|uniref:DUF2218 domain-containing protein n=1 Tax=Paracoccus bogoriensis TaxID=242065 RepID=UPI001C6812D6|nr:DUF2218 domain-containing protein [Paracoccus bogoriensis]MBW7057062.1 DUF2218 domain-containing protein [Paracoccus bogoriensis]